VSDNAHHEHFMKEALKEAQKAFREGESPIGAVIVHKNKIIARAHNQVEMLKDATAHAEMIAITQAAGSLGDWRLTDAALYVTKEPCFMCSGALVLSRIKHLIFGVRDDRVGGAGSALGIVNYSRANHHVSVTGGVLEAEAKALLQDFFKAQRVKEKSAIAQNN
jgi:tRNA(adenine34) deaminase